jgi:hypothetical protein
MVHFDRLKSDHIKTYCIPYPKHKLIQMLAIAGGSVPIWPDPDLASEKAWSNSGSEFSLAIFPRVVFWKFTPEKMSNRKTCLFCKEYKASSAVSDPVPIKIFTSPDLTIKSSDPAQEQGLKILRTQRRAIFGS